MQDHIGIADRLDLAAVRARRITCCLSDDMKTATAVMLRSVCQHPDHQSVGAGLIPVNDPASRVTVNDPVLQPAAARGRQGADAIPDAVQIERQPAIARGQPVLDGGAKPLCQNRRVAAGRNCEDHRITIDDRAKIKTAQRRLVRHIDRHAHLAGAA